MTRIPNGEQALVPLEEFTEYALNPHHPTGRHKARVFELALGFTAADAVFLRDLVQSAAATHDAIQQEASAHGERYVIDFELTTARGTAVIRSAWIIRHGENFPRLTSCYVIER